MKMDSCSEGRDRLINIVSISDQSGWVLNLAYCVGTLDVRLSRSMMSEIYCHTPHSHSKESSSIARCCRLKIFLVEHHDENAFSFYPVPRQGMRLGSR